MQEIIKIFAEAFPDAATEVTADVRSTIDELVRTGALKLKPARTASDESIGSKSVPDEP